jgi:hypothetical protein
MQPTERTSAGRKRHHRDGPTWSVPKAQRRYANATANVRILHNSTVRNRANRAENPVSMRYRIIEP